MLRLLPCSNLADASHERSTTVPAKTLVSVVLAELVDQLIGHQTTARGEGPQPVSRLRLLHAAGPARVSQSLSGQLGEHLANRLSFVPSPLLRCAEYIVGNVERGAHASDGIASDAESHLGRSKPLCPAISINTDDADPALKGTKRPAAAWPRVVPSEAVRARPRLCARARLHVTKEAIAQLPCSHTGASSDRPFRAHHLAGTSAVAGVTRESGTNAATATMIAEASSRWPGRKFPTVA